MGSGREKYRKHEILTLSQRIEVVRLSERGVSQRSLAERFKCSKTQIQNTLANKARYLSEFEDDAVNKMYKRKRTSVNSSVNDLVLKWYQWAKTNDVGITGPILQEKAREFAARLNINGFAASNGWLESFRKRHGIKLTKRRSCFSFDNLEVPAEEPQNEEYSQPGIQIKSEIETVTVPLPITIAAPPASAASFSNSFDSFQTTSHIQQPTPPVLPPEEWHGGHFEEQQIATPASAIRNEEMRDHATVPTSEFPSHGVIDTALFENKNIADWQMSADDIDVSRASLLNSTALLEQLSSDVSHSFIGVPQQPPPAPQKQSLPAQQSSTQPQKLPPPQPSTAPKPIAPKPPPPQPVSPLQPSPPEVCLRWNSYHSNMQATFPSLLNNEQFVDVTLACEGRSIKCHKVMLSACSSYFEELLSQNPCQHPIVLMKDLRYWEVQALVDFMYRGEVNVGQDKLPSLLAAAEALQIKGLAGPASSTGHDDDPASSSIPMSSAEDYLEESVPSPSNARRARKRRVMNTAPTPRSIQPHPPQPQQVHAPAPGRSSSGKQRVARPAVSMPSTSNYQHESATSVSEPPTRRARKSDASDLIGEIKIEPIDIEISNDSMDQIDDSFMDKTYDDTETGEGGESSCHGDDPGGTGEDSKETVGIRHRTKLQGQDNDQIDFGDDNGISSANDQNFSYEDSGSHDGLATVPDIPGIPGTSYQSTSSQPSGSGMNSDSGGGNISDNLLRHI